MQLAEKLAIPRQKTKPTLQLIDVMIALSVAMIAVNIANDVVSDKLALHDIIIDVIGGISIPFFLAYGCAFVLSKISGLKIKVRLNDEIGKIEWKELLPEAKKLFLMFMALDLAFYIFFSKEIMHYVILIPENILMASFCSFLQHYFFKKSLGQ